MKEPKVIITSHTQASNKYLAVADGVIFLAESRSAFKRMCKRAHALEGQCKVLVIDIACETQESIDDKIDAFIEGVLKR